MNVHCDVMCKSRSAKKKMKKSKLSMLVEKNQSQNIAFFFLEQTDDFKLKVAFVLLLIFFNLLMSLAQGDS